ncbi:hypothetical protein ABW286_14225 [Erwinia papayae]|uniref:DNA-binding protein n=1 Tax=Erwinia papayae TaxID=206499 RepID=A0ABV3N3C0_9GAMM
MNNLKVISGSSAAMTHKEIADLVHSRPDNVKVSIERLAERGVIRLPAMQEIEEINNLGLPVKREYYQFEGVEGKRDSIVVVAQLSPEFTAQLVDHWRELEEEVSRLKNDTQPATQEISMNNDLLSLARVVAEATASATMKAVIDVAGLQVIQQPAVAQPAVISPLPTTASITTEAAHDDGDIDQAKFVPVSDLVWACGFSDAACRRLATFAKLETCLTNGDRGRLLIHRETFMTAAQGLLDGSTPPTGKRQRWQHPEFGGFTLRLKSTSLPKGDE